MIEAVTVADEVYRAIEQGVEGQGARGVAGDLGSSAELGGTAAGFCKQTQVLNGNGSLSSQGHENADILLFKMGGLAVCAINMTNPLAANVKRGKDKAAGSQALNINRAGGVVEARVGGGMLDKGNRVGLEQLGGSGPRFDWVAGGNAFSRRGLLLILGLSRAARGGSSSPAGNRDVPFGGIITKPGAVEQADGDVRGVLVAQNGGTAQNGQDFIVGLG